VEKIPLISNELSATVQTDVSLWHAKVYICVQEGEWDEMAINKGGGDQEAASEAD
jgi:hypothetical protein